MVSFIAFSFLGWEHIVSSEMKDKFNKARNDLHAWQQSRPLNYYQADINFQNILRMHFGTRYAESESTLLNAGSLAATAMDDLVRESNRHFNLPRIERFDDIGKKTESVVFHDSYHELGERIWSTGVLYALKEKDDLLCGALDYLIAHHGEAGHTCPIACTAGLIKLLEEVGSRDQQTRYLSLLLSQDYHQRLHAAQFVTEVQGGSDVGLNACRAEIDDSSKGIYRIYGEKWFCSVIDASLFVVSARVDNGPEGTKGLGLFLVPRTVDGEVNHFSIRRLKDKLGTRSMASAEVDFEGALAEAIGPLDKGFKHLVGIVLDTSRNHNAVVACGIMRRALIEAHLFAAKRVAFKTPILNHPMVQEILARMRVFQTAALSTTFRVLKMQHEINEGKAPGYLPWARRIHVSMNKYWTANLATQCARDGIEVLGGNGTIEDFSVLPRLYRDAMVIESWEGTHNTLCAQILRDFATRGMHRQFCKELNAALFSIEHPELFGQRDIAESYVKKLSETIGKTLAMSESQASLAIRKTVDMMCEINGYMSLLLELQWEKENSIKSDKEDILELYRKIVLEKKSCLDDPRIFALHQQISKTI